MPSSYASHTIADGKASRPAYTVGTLVTDWALYDKMIQSMRERGFGDDCEFLTVDNSSGNQADAYTGLNRMLNDARGRTIILCHQDVELVDDGREQLDRCLAELEAIDPAWAIAGNAGCDGFHVMYLCVSSATDTYRSPDLPKRVHSLDENFLVIRPEARLSFSRDLAGFHMYGADICTIADILGWNAYVIPFHLAHYGEAKMGEPFRQCEVAFVAKWRRALRHRQLQTTVVHLLLVGENCPAWYAWLKRKWTRAAARWRTGRLVC
ncbi:hypothetical protein ABMA32_19190 [Mesorhizobium sp. VNQ89]|uniref:hypothetical protein n=1 Tax=Mesorhizobium quangtriensis TaxID=3157709 RepID=UPI0032B86926